MSVSFGDFLREKRKDRYFTVKNFARLIGKSVSYVSQLESNSRPAPKQKMLKNISNALVLNEKEREIFYDLAAKTRNTIPDNISEYINAHNEVKKTLLISEKREIPDEEWQRFLSEIKDKYLL